MSQSVYVIKSEAGPVKIGIAANPHARLAELLQGQPFDAELVHVEYVPDGRAPTIEAAAHVLLKEKRRRGEWFDITQDQAIEALQLAVEYVESGLTTTKQVVRAHAARKLDSMRGKRMPEEIARPIWQCEKLTADERLKLLNPHGYFAGKWTAASAYRHLGKKQ